MSEAERPTKDERRAIDTPVPASANSSSFGRRLIAIAPTYLFLFALCAALDAVVQVGQLRRSNLLQSEGETVSTTVIHHQIATRTGSRSSGYQTHTQYFLTLSATTSTGRTGVRQEEVSRSEYESIEDGDTKRMVVARSHPTSMAEPGDTDLVAPATFSFGRLFGSAACWSLLFGFAMTYGRTPHEFVWFAPGRRRGTRRFG